MQLHVRSFLCFYDVHNVRGFWLVVYTKQALKTVLLEL